MGCHGCSLIPPVPAALEEGGSPPHKADSGPSCPKLSSSLPSSAAAGLGLHYFQREAATSSCSRDSGHTSSPTRAAQTAKTSPWRAAPQAV